MDSNMAYVFRESTYCNLCADWSMTPQNIASTSCSATSSDVGQAFNISEVKGVSRNLTDVH